MGEWRRHADVSLSDTAPDAVPFRMPPSQDSTGSAQPQMDSVHGGTVVWPSN
jgi:hypothetical protein